MTGRVDHAALRTNQAFIIGLLLLSFVLDWPWMVVITALVMALGAARPRWGLFTAIYRSFLRDRFVRPELHEDNPEPHRFSHGFGAVVLAIAVVLFSSGPAAVAWAVVGLVVLLAAINLFAGFCAGCFLYYRLARLGVKGFTAKPIEGTVPGMRPG